MRITILDPGVSQNGGTRVIGIYARKLLDMGHEVALVSHAPQLPSAPRRFIDALRGRPHRIDPNRTRFVDPIGSAFVEIDRDGPFRPSDLPDADVVVATFWTTAYEAAALPPEKGAKVYFVQGHEVFSPKTWHISRGTYFLPLKKITISSHLRDIMAREYGDHDVPVVPNSVDTDLFHAPPRGRADVPTVGLLYDPSPVKGVDISLRAIEIARKRVPGLRVVAFGKGRPQADLPLPADHLYVQLPDQERIRDLYASCDVWLCGSRTEGFHLPPLEAMACRTPVVMTRIGGAVETVDEGVNGHIVDVEDAETLGARLTDVLTLPEEQWRAMSKAAHARARSYTWDDAVRRFADELRHVAEGERD